MTDNAFALVEARRGLDCQEGGEVVPLTGKR
jgi:hypothetical protein